VGLAEELAQDALVIALEQWPQSGVPDNPGAWLMTTAKRRAIEPDQIDDTAYARFMPAIVSATTLHPITATLNFAFNNNLAEALDKGDGG